MSKKQSTKYRQHLKSELAESWLVPPDNVPAHPEWTNDQLDRCGIVPDRCVICPLCELQREATDPCGYLACPLID